MRPEEFIRKHVVAELLKDGYSEAAAQGGASEAVDHYRRASKASSRQGIFADCLHHAKTFVKYGKRNKTRSAKGQLF